MCVLPAKDFAHINFFYLLIYSPLCVVCVIIFVLKWLTYFHFFQLLFLDLYKNSLQSLSGRRLWLGCGLLLPAHPMPNLPLLTLMLPFWPFCSLNSPGFLLSQSLFKICQGSSFWPLLYLVKLLILQITAEMFLFYLPGPSKLGHDPLPYALMAWCNLPSEYLPACCCILSISEVPNPQAADPYPSSAG